MSKERLEEIINELPYSVKYEGNVEMLIEYAKKQAKRVQELESESYNAHLERLLDRRERQNKRYREALERLLKESRNYEKNTNLISFLEEALEESE